MGKKKEEEQLKVVEVEMRVSMHCNACERSVAKAISNFKGVEKFTTDMKKQRVVVVGRVNPQKLTKKVKKKTGKRVEMVEKKKEEGSKKEEGNGFHSCGSALLWGYCSEMDVLTVLFSDENANACSIL